MPEAIAEEDEEEEEEDDEEGEEGEEEEKGSNESLQLDSFEEGVDLIRHDEREPRTCCIGRSHAIRRPLQ